MSLVASSPTPRKNAFGRDDRPALIGVRGCLLFPPFPLPFPCDARIKIKRLETTCNKDIGLCVYELPFLFFFSRAGWCWKTGSDFGFECEVLPKFKLHKKLSPFFFLPFPPPTGQCAMATIVEKENKR